MYLAISTICFYSCHHACPLLESIHSPQHVSIFCGLGVLRLGCCSSCCECNGHDTHGHHQNQISDPGIVTYCTVLLCHCHCTGYLTAFDCGIFVLSNETVFSNSVMHLEQSSSSLFRVIHVNSF